MVLHPMDMGTKHISTTTTMCESEITASGGRNEIESVSFNGKKNSGRPRKHDSNGKSNRPFVSSTPPLPVARPKRLPPPPGFHLKPTHDFASTRGRGRPHTSGSDELHASLGDALAKAYERNFTPLVIRVYIGEDVTQKLLSVFQDGPRCIFIISANGTVDNVTIRHVSGGVLKFEEKFDILRLSGAYTISDDRRVQTEGFSVLLAGPDGRVIGGNLGGSLYAATPIQMVVGSFILDGYKKPKKQQHGRAMLASPLVHPAPEVVHSTPDLNVEVPME